MTSADLNTYEGYDLDECDTVDPWDVQLSGKRLDPYKLERLAESMQSEGWAGRPILVAMGTNEAWTGEHRVYVAMCAGITEVPVVWVPTDRRSGAWALRPCQLATDRDRADELAWLAVKDHRFVDAHNLMQDELDRQEDLDENQL